MVDFFCVCQRGWLVWLRHSDATDCFFQNRIRVCFIKIMKKSDFLFKSKKLTIPFRMTTRWLMSIWWAIIMCFPVANIPFFYVHQKPKQTSNMNFMIFFLFVHISIIPQTNSRSLIIFHNIIVCCFFFCYDHWCAAL